MPRCLALLHAASAVVLGTVWFTVLVTLWSTGLGLAVTLLGLPLIWATLVASEYMARFEAGLARAWLGVDVDGPVSAPGWRLVERLRARSTWNAQLYLLLRFVPGLAVGSALLGLAVGGVSLLVQGIVEGRDWMILAAIPAIPLGPVLAWWLAGAYAALWRPLAARLLGPDAATIQPIRVRVGPIAAIALAAQAICLIVWAATDTSSVWPAWTAFGLGTWVAYAAAQTVWATGGVTVVMTVVIWALSGGGYFWPVWVALGVAILLAAHQLAERTNTRQRLGQLTRTRAEVVGAQEDELRRIERDLHDGAQARLVSLSMSLGLAESRLDEDPERARELMGEAQEQARTALKELRDLARGIAPPVLQDRGLTAAIEALTATAPLNVEVHGDPERAPAAIERAGYFVAAEALANAAKHARAARVRVGVTRFDDRLEVEVADDGRGGADPDGSGLTGLKQRVEAVDGTLEVRSTPAGTIVRASLPCASS